MGSKQGILNASEQIVGELNMFKMHIFNLQISAARMHDLTESNVVNVIAEDLTKSLSIMVEQVKDIEHSIDGLNDCSECKWREH
jgi:hypothetical protein